jgi:hypothetical protein
LTPFSADTIISRRCRPRRERDHGIDERHPTKAGFRLVAAKLAAVLDTLS